MITNLHRKDLLDQRYSTGSMTLLTITTVLLHSTVPKSGLILKKECLCKG